MWIKFQNNPAGRKVGDCAVRAVSVALDMSWEDAYNPIADAGFKMADMPSSDSVWGAILRSYGFYRHAIPSTCPDCYTAADFAEDNPPLEAAPSYSYATEPENHAEPTIGYYSDTEFSDAIYKQDAERIWAVMDELMEVLHITQPRLYNGVLNQIRGL